MLNRNCGLAFCALVAIATGVAADAVAKPTADIRVLPGFRAELIYAPPLEVEGSWVSLTVDELGRLIASDQEGALYRITPPPPGTPAARTKVDKIDLGIGMAQGLACLDGKLYVMLNGVRGSLTSGLYRLSDSTGDDRYDHVEQLRVWSNVGEHGPHAVVVGPNKRSLYVCCGNATRLPMYDRTRVPKAWQDDRLLPPLFAAEFVPGQFEAPGGWIARTDLNGELMELYAAGLRNVYDIAFDPDGELFTFDSDNEGDVGLPWYRPTRVCHVTSGVDFGWRATDGVWPAGAIDSLPPAVDVGPGSPTGLEFGTHTKFPPKYRRAMFAGEWSYGKIYAVHLRPEGASYRGKYEQFAAGLPLPVTDLVANPVDGALYFVVGGRKIESGLYRIAWVGGDAAAEELTADVDSQQAAAAGEARRKRRELEAFHVGAPEGAVDKAWPYLASNDPALRSAARIVLEQQPIQRWGEAALNEPDPRRRIAALVAMARMGSAALGDVWTESLRRIDCAALPESDQFDYVRAASLGVLRLGLSPENRQKLLARLDPLHPSGNAEFDAQLAPLLVRLAAPRIKERLLARLTEAPTLSEGFDAARAASAISADWTIDERRQFFAWCRRAAAETNAGAFKSLVEIRNRALQSLTAAERTALAAELAKSFEQPTTPLEAIPARPFVQKWTLDEAIAAVEAAGEDRDLDNGRRLFTAALCANCHVFAGRGAMVGPDLTGAGGRFALSDLLRAIVEPDTTISDQYQQTRFTVNGRVFTGRVSNMHGEEIFVSTDFLDPTKYVKFSREDLEDQRPSDVSPMPAGLLDTLAGEEIADLVAFLRSGAR
ncbi:MAG: c-type cytochrome [Pirellulales bacterium]|nr:c-type cytochrome [Pirellulales bacterium]